MKIGAVSMRSELGEVEKNLERMESLVQEASQRGAELLCFPELCVTGYSLRRAKELAGVAAEAHVVERLGHMARRCGILLLAGFVESAETGPPYITHLVAGPEGLLGTHRKTHLSPPEAGVYAEGLNLEVFRYGDVVFGVQLCWEAHYPEISTLMALQGADLLLFPHASPRGTPDEKLSSWLRHLTARAYDNTAYVVACNLAGSTPEGLSFPGVAVALGPDGRILDQYAGGGDHVLLVDVDSSRVAAVRREPMRHFLGRRRPELFGEVSQRKSSGGE